MMGWGEEFKNLPKMADVWSFFPSEEGGDKASKGGGSECPMPPPP